MSDRFSYDPIRLLTMALDHHARVMPDQPALAFEGAPGAPAGDLTFAELVGTARRTAAGLRATMKPGERALLLLPSGIEYVTALLGCFYAGVIAVPVNLPGPSRLARVLGKIDAIAADATPRAVITTREIAAASDATFAAFVLRHRLTPILLDDLPPVESPDLPVLTPETVAFLQYTSGSTGEPKGVINTHEALVHNFDFLRCIGCNHDRTVVVNWMPLFHDMGLILGVLQPLYYGNRSVLLAAARFAQKPATLLQAVTRHRATLIAGPNFAYDLCVRRVTDEEIAGLDLSSLESVVTAAEPVRAETIERFLQRFAPVGARRETIKPCYGLAEATLMAAGVRNEQGPVVLHLDKAALLEDRAILRPTASGSTRSYVASGNYFSDQSLLIVDPESGRALPDGHCGEIWIKGRSIGPGYWNRPEVNIDVFEAQVARKDGTTDGPYMRTGDLGFLQEGRIYITGRRKDVLILRGECHYPDDIEQTAVRLDPRLVPEGGACFAVETETGEAAVLVHEVERCGNADADAGLLERIHAGVAAEHGIPLHAITLIRKGTLRKTTSGKVRRVEMRRAWLADELVVVAQRVWPTEGEDAAPAEMEMHLGDRLRQAGTAVRRLQLTDLIQALIRRKLGLSDRRRLPDDVGFFDLGLDSVAAVEVASELQRTLGIELPDLLAFENPTVSGLVDHLMTVFGESAGDNSSTGRPSRAADEPIAIVGMGCRMPGDRGDLVGPDAFLDFLLEGRSAMRPDPRSESAGMSRTGSFLEAIDAFDAGFFRLSPREAASLDPQHRLVLEAAWHALEDAGIDPLALRGSSASVHLGIGAADYGHLPFSSDDPDAFDAHYGTGNSAAAAAGRLSFALGIEGEAIVVDTACSSSLAAVHLACRSLRAGDSYLAFAGGVQALIAPEIDRALAKAGMLAADGRCKTFDAAADGYVRGEGVGMIVLKRLSDAQADGDRIHAVIRDTSLRQEGARSGLTVPDGKARTRLIQASLRRAGVEPGTIGYAELHGTGTRLGDPIEYRSLIPLFQDGRTKPLHMGTVKSNVGHLEAAAGIAGLIKAAGAIRRGLVPPHLHLETLNPAIDLTAIPATLPSRVMSWPDDVAHPRRASVASYGFSGAIAHAVIEQAPPVAAETDSEATSAPLLLPISARSPQAFADLREAYRRSLASYPEQDVAAFCRSAARCRAHLELRGCAIGHDASDLLAALDRLTHGEAPGRPRIGFLFTGQGAQYPGMAMELFAADPSFRHALEEADAALRPHLGRSVIELIRESDEATLRRTANAQPALFAIGHALASMWRAYGIQPSVVAGHSIGEFAAAVTAGHLALDEVAAFVVARGRLMDALETPGAMLAVRADRAALDPLVARHAELAIAAVNGPADLVVAGAVDAVVALEREVADAGLSHRRLDVSHAFHSPVMDPVLPALRRAADGFTPGEDGCVFVSTLHGGPVGPEETASGRYWAEHARGTVLFHQAVQTLQAMGCDHIIEIGPKPILAPIVRRALTDPAPAVLPSLDPMRGTDASVVAATLAELYVRGADLDWSTLRPGRLLAPEVLPVYPFERTPHWYPFGRRLPAPMPASAEPGPGLHQLVWREVPVAPARTPRRLIIVPDHGGIAGGIIADLRAEGIDAIGIDGRNRRGIDQALKPGDAILFLRSLDARDPRDMGPLAELVALAQHLATRHSDHALHVVTAVGVALPGESPQPGMASFWGAIRSLRIEMDRLEITIADLPESELEGTGCTSALLHAIAQAGARKAVALRGQRVHIARLAEFEDHVDASSLRLPDDAVYMIAGGFGGIGRQLARWLADRGARHLVLLGRRPPDAAGRAMIAELDDRGVTVRAIALDIAERSAVEDLFVEIEAGMKAGRFPPLRGVFHAAGVGRWQDLQSLSHDDLRAMADAKIAGSLNLHEATRHLELDHFVLFSSIAGVWGSREQIGYAAVNAFQDALAQARRAQGLPAVAVAWGPWAGEGMADVDHERRGRLTRAGITVAQPSWYMERLERVLAAGAAVPPCLVAADVDWRRFGPIHQAMSGLDLFDNDPGSSGGMPAREEAGPTTGARLESRLRGIVAAILGTSEAALKPDLNLLTLGLDSILVMDLVRRIGAELGVDLPLRVVFEAPTLSAIIARVADAASPSAEPSAFRITPDPGRRNAPFPLTSLQHAYLVGREDGLTLGNVACHAYLEIDAGRLDPARLEDAWNVLIARHDALRLVFAPDGTQRVLKAVPRHHVTVADMRGTDEATFAGHIDAWREELSHKVHPADSWPLFDLRATLVAEDSVRLHLSMDLLVSDATSAQILLNELAALLRHDADPMKAGLRPFAITFRDFVLALDNPSSGLGAERERARDWWLARIDDLPPAPDLPLAVKPESITAPRFTRRQGRIEAARWTGLKETIAARGLTPASFLLGVFAEVLARWSTQPRFTLSLTLFDRRPWHEDVAHLVGDFTAVTLLPVDCGTDMAFADQAIRLHREMLDVLDHRAFDAVEIMRALNRERSEDPQAMPVVFTSQLGVAAQAGQAELLAQQSYAITQTPQLWLDHQVMEIGGDLVFNWDAVEALFAPGVLDAMFGAYERVLGALCAGGSAWDRTLGDLLPDDQRAVRARVNRTDAAVSDRCLHDLFFDTARHTPNATAVIGPDGQGWSYGALETWSLGLAGDLLRARDRGSLAGERIAILMDKSPAQAAAALAILAVGGVYVPLDPSQPDARLAAILDGSAIRFAVHEAGLSPRLEALMKTHGVRMVSAAETVRAGEAALARPVRVPVTDPAYLLYTSGSTGVPKGVLLDHRGPVNTVLDINRRFDVGSDDRLFALSALGFDLSVYDLFGAFAAGAALVFPSAEGRRDPAHWAELARRHGVTVWNSVPALFDMFLAEGDDAALSSLRTVLLSGDWVPLGLPSRFRAVNGHARLIAMGGATEASIWSNWFEVGEVPAQWTSIPYGYPLTNQRYHVLDGARRHRPDWVEGDLHIAGVGLAIGYENEAERTKASFFHHDGLDDRLYRTGDMARYWPDGTLEFLGRKDMQVKIGGHRIELGEIEAALTSHPGVRDAVVDALPTGSGGDRTSQAKRLHAWVVLRDGGDADDAVHRVDRIDEAAAFDLWHRTHEAASRPLAGSVGPSSDPDALRAFLSAAAAQAARDSLAVLGMQLQPGASLTRATAAGRFGIVPEQRAVFEDWLDMLVARGDLAADGGEIVVMPGVRDLAWDRLGEQARAFGLDAGLIRRLRDDAARRAAVLRGEEDALSLFFGAGDDTLAPEILSRTSPSGPAMVEALAGALAERARLASADRPVRILQIETRRGRTAADITRALPAEGWHLTLADSSRAFLADARETLAASGHADHPSIAFRPLDPEADFVLQGLEPASFDAVVLFNALHRTRDIGAMLDRLKRILAPGGLLLAPEMTRDTDLQRVTIALLGEGSQSVSDHRHLTGEWQLGPDAWCRALASAGFVRSDAIAPPRAADGFAFLVAQQAEVTRAFDPGRLRAHAATRLPAYMVPHVLIELDALPLSPTGKVDRKRLPKPVAPVRTDAPAGDLDGAGRAIALIWTELLGVPVTSPGQSFFDAGGDSLIAVRVVERIRRELKLRITVRDLFEAPRLGAFAARVAALAPEKGGDLPVLVPRPEERHAPFPLTDVQEAYWVGRQDTFALGGVASHLYTEIEVEDLGLSAIEQAWRALIRRHDMMRAVIDGDGYQRILPAVPDYAIPVLDLRDRTSSEVEDSVADIRTAMSHQVRPADRWPLFEVRAARLPGGRIRLFVSLDNMVFDGRSMGMIIAEWGVLARAGGSADILPAIGCSFRDVVLALRAAEGGADWRRARDYWLDRLDGLPAAPDLPLLEAADGPPRFVRREAALDSGRWKALRQRAQAEGVTVNAVLLAAYGESLSAWSRSARFTLNLTLFQRPPLHPDIDRVVGDFTSLILLAFDGEADEAFIDRARRVQAQLSADLDHASVSAVRVLREMAKRTGVMRGVACPIVFTSALGAAGAGDAGRPIGQLGWGITQTPQVWIDHQAREADGVLVYNWDAVEAIFDPAVLDGMFGLYRGLLDRLGSDAGSWTLACASLLRQLGKERTGAPVPPRPLLPADPAPVSLPSPSGPLDDIEGVIAELLGKELGSAPRSRDVNFFELGATSLALIRVCQALRHRLAIDLPVVALFDHTTIGSLAAYVRSRRTAKGSERTTVAAAPPLPSRLGRAQRRSLARAHAARS